MGQSNSKVDSIFTSKVNILMIGYDYGGKTTILHNLKIGEISQVIPMIGFSYEQAKYNNLNIINMDLSQNRWNRRLMGMLFKDIDAITFVINSSEDELFTDIKESLEYLFNQANAFSISEISKRINTLEIKDRKWYLQPTIAINNNFGVLEGFQWLSDISEIAMSCIQVGFYIERVENKYFNITSWDSNWYRESWRLYFNDIDAIIYVIDSTDQRSLDSISINITTILSEVQLIGKPILFFYNYQDAHDALSISEISARINTNDIKDRQWFTQPTAAIDNNSGVLEGFQWLSNILIDESNHHKTL
ncbi:hypothetical protein PPL_11289 [Heterostelium album PN500]|uniref:ADP-ribosylation factor n=1 Tax=Heterostelium pallidum (strain ATCC 26659 / Pp 5 / PN500) TaxID=670386 RepID=D3BU29_HETP5|nr:hypothetical protein PPL_11289 [Heterostelium album PN500]EFA75215.1 hypothetical protein PPL_11289 [Heterostelium album PN500]|eukprot:XP_020427349.1 hypothetical protein PPL_11289 [Heterostelium album PN500]